MSKKYNPAEREAYWQKYWDEQQTYAFNPASKKPFYSIDTPPPTVSGKMHMGHAFMYTQMDFIARFKRMTGHELFYPFGTDDNGLPTQILIEKMKKVRAAQLGRKEFTKLCLETLTKELRPTYVADWKRIAMSCDWGIFYTTIDAHSQKISQRSFIELAEKKRAYRKKAPVMICPKCRTAIAQVELEDHKRESTLYYVKAIVSGSKSAESITFATTRPELMMACIAITVHPDDKRYKKIVGKTAVIPVSNVEVPIIADDMSKMEFGTGAVYWCPYGDAQDVEFVAKHPELEVKHIMNPDGKLNEFAGKYVGLRSDAARAAVVEDWKAAGAIVKEEKTEQTVNVHERCGKAIEFVAMKQWFIKVLDKKKKWLQLGKKLNWKPEHMRNRYDNWAKGLKWDWNISRQIYFGVPFPVWYCEKCETPTFAEIEELPVDPLVDKPKGPCGKCGEGRFIPEDDIINTWATSSLTPQLAIELFDKKVGKKLYPMNLRPQGHDIISFWLFNTVVKAHLHYNSLPWEDVMITGWALDPHGKKMSKSKGNVIEPQKMIEKYSADALRFWAGSSTLGEDLPFQEKELVTGQKFVKKMWNASSFCFMHLDGFDGKKPKNLLFFDRWLLHRLQQVIEICTTNFEQHEYSKTKQETEKFFWHAFCDNYLEIVKDRLYNAERGVEAKKSAQFVLQHTLLAVLKLMAPIIPHITEEIYQQYFAKKEKQKSIHTSLWPHVEKKFVDDKIGEQGEVVLDIITAVRRYKSQQGMALNADINELVIDGSKMKNFDEIIAEAADDLHAVLHVKTISSGSGTLPCDKFPVKIAVK